MTAAVLVFAALGASVAALLVLLAPRRTGLLAAIGRIDAARLDASRYSRTGSPAADPLNAVRHILVQFGTRFPLTTRGPERSAQDLAVTGRSAESHAMQRALVGVVGFCALPALALALAPAGVSVPAVGVLAGSLALAVAGFWIPEAALRAEAERRRRVFRRALSCYLDLVAMSLAGGRGAPQALPEAAALSDGWAFGLIGDALDTARLAGHTPWRGLGELGDRLGVPELRELSASLALVGDHGARVRDTLTARAATLRRRALTDAEGQATQADQSMRIAQVLLAFGFLILIAYPALAAVLAL